MHQRLGSFLTHALQTRLSKCPSSKKSTSPENLLLFSVSALRRGVLHPLVWYTLESIDSRAANSASHKSLPWPCERVNRSLAMLSSSRSLEGLPSDGISRFRWNFQRGPSFSCSGGGTACLQFGQYRGCWQQREEQARIAMLGTVARWKRKR
jgi:hypothetical protein